MKFKELQQKLNDIDSIEHGNDEIKVEVQIGNTTFWLEITELRLYDDVSSDRVWTVVAE